MFMNGIQRCLNAAWSHMVGQGRLQAYTRNCNGICWKQQRDRFQEGGAIVNSWGGGTHAGRTSAHSWMKGVGHELTAIPQKQSFVDPLEHTAAMSQSWLPQLLSAGPQQPIHP